MNNLLKERWYCSTVDLYESKNRWSWSLQPCLFFIFYIFIHSVGFVFPLWTFTVAVSAHVPAVWVEEVNSNHSFFFPSFSLFSGWAVFFSQCTCPSWLFLLCEKLILTYAPIFYDLSFLLIFIQVPFWINNLVVVILMCYGMYGVTALEFWWCRGHSMCIYCTSHP